MLRLRFFTHKCTFRRQLSCKNQPKKGPIFCPIQDDGFTRLLDFYFEGGIKENDISGVHDPRAVPRLKCIEIACWFDDDFHALEVYCHWKKTGILRMTSNLCQQFKRAWSRYYVRLKPLNVKRPKWHREDVKWQGISLGWTRNHS